jgi:hypothetical protein
MITKQKIKQTIKQPSSCPEGFIPVPGSYLYGTMNENGGFCVMKYHARNGVGDKINSSCVDGNEGSDTTMTVVSTYSGTPSVNINFCAAKKACENSGYHLITNEEWMTIARNIELVPNNYTSGDLGDGNIYRGHYNNVPSTIIASSSDDSNGYYLISSPNLDQRRTLYLNNGSIIWDFTGNAWSFIDFLISKKDHADAYYSLDDSIFDSNNDDLFLIDYSKGGSNDYYLNYNNLGDTTLGYKDIFLLNSNYNALNNGIGIYSANSNRGSVTETLTSMIRGGDRQNKQYSGLMEASYPGLASTGNTVGFRCVK